MKDCPGEPWAAKYDAWCMKGLGHKGHCQHVYGDHHRTGYTENFELNIRLRLQEDRRLKEKKE